MGYYTIFIGRPHHHLLSPPELVEKRITPTALTTGNCQLAATQITNQPPAGRTPTYQLLTSVQLFQGFEMNKVPSIFDRFWKGKKGTDWIKLQARRCILSPGYSDVGFVFSGPCPPVFQFHRHLHMFYIYLANSFFFFFLIFFLLKKSYISSDMLRI